MLNSNRLAPSQATVTAMCDLAIELLQNNRNITEQDVVFDLGCGKGAFLNQVARKTLCQRIVGIEYNQRLVKIARQTASREGFREKHYTDSFDCALCPDKDPSSGRVKIHLQDALTTDISTATVIFLYLVPAGMKLIAPKIIPLLQTGNCRVITNAFTLPKCKEAKRIVYKCMPIRLYTQDSIQSDTSQNLTSKIMDTNDATHSDNMGVILSDNKARSELDVEKLVQVAITRDKALDAFTAKVLSLSKETNKQVSFHEPRLSKHKFLLSSYTHTLSTSVLLREVVHTHLLLIPFNSYL